MRQPALQQSLKTATLHDSRGSSASLPALGRSYAPNASISSTPTASRGKRSTLEQQADGSLKITSCVLIKAGQDV
jgi:hypothetical protein